MTIYIGSSSSNTFTSFSDRSERVKYDDRYSPKDDYFLTIPTSDDRYLSNTPFGGTFEEIDGGIRLQQFIKFGYNDSTSSPYAMTVVGHYNDPSDNTFTYTWQTVVLKYGRIYFAYPGYPFSSIFLPYSDGITHAFDRRYMETYQGFLVQKDPFHGYWGFKLFRDVKDSFSFENVTVGNGLYLSTVNTFMLEVKTIDGNKRAPEWWYIRENDLGATTAQDLRHSPLIAVHDTFYTQALSSGSPPSAYVADISINGYTHSRISTHTGHCVGSGRIYPIGEHGNEHATNASVTAGVFPYWPTTSSSPRSQYTFNVLDKAGQCRTSNIIPAGGMVFLTESDFQPSQAAAGCGRYVIADNNYGSDYEMHSSNGITRYGKALLYTQDGDYIKDLTPKDDSYSVLGYSEGMRFGAQIQIKNNLIFILAPKYESLLNSSWKKGRMYIYSLDGELLAAFSPNNFGLEQANGIHFGRFETDGVNLYLLDNDRETVSTSSFNYASSTDFPNGHTRSLHLKLPQTLSGYYDELIESFRY